MTPLEQLREMRKKHFPSYSQTYSETLEHCACGVWRYKECDAIKLLDALEAILAKCYDNGFTTWDRDRVPMTDGKYDPSAAKEWELMHGHDIRLKCYPEYGCLLLIDPAELLTLIASALKGGDGE